jgi:hypothetical protein
MLLSFLLDRALNSEHLGTIAREQYVVARSMVCAANSREDPRITRTDTVDYADLSIARTDTG